MNDQSRQPSKPRTVHRAVRLEYYMPSEVLMSARLKYSEEDPYTTTIEWRDGEQWMFAREILAAALKEPAGLGDIRCWTVKDDFMVLLEVPDGRSLFSLPAREVRLFLQATYKIFPLGEEVLDMDAGLAELLGRN